MACLDHRYERGAYGVCKRCGGEDPKVQEWAAFKLDRQPLIDARDAASETYRTFPGSGSGPMGLTPDHIRNDPLYQMAAKSYWAAEDRIRRFDHAFMRAHHKTWPLYFKTQAAEERLASRSARLTQSSNNKGGETNADPSV